MGKSVMILLPYIGCQDKVQGRDRLSPGELVRHLKPFCMLCCHGVNNTDKRLIACEETVTAGEKISL